MQKIKVFLILTAAMAVLLCSGLGAQSTEILDDLLSEGQATYGQAAYMVLAGTGRIDESSTESQAVQYASDEGWNPHSASAETPAKLGDFSFLVMEALGMKGGIFYSLIPSPRYAVRELAYLGIIEEHQHPDQGIDGAEVVRILSAAIEESEAAE